MCVSEMGWNGFFENSWIVPLNNSFKTIFLTLGWGFPRGLIFFLIGFYARYLTKIPVAYWAIASFATTILFFGEAIYVRDAGYYYNVMVIFSLPLLIISLMALILKFCHDTQYVNEGKQLRRFSTFLYMSHPIIMAVVYKIFGRFHGFSCLLVVCAISLTLFLLHDKLQTRKYFRWLRYAC